MIYTLTFNPALDYVMQAENIVGKDKQVTIIPDGISVIVK